MIMSSLVLQAEDLLARAKQLDKTLQQNNIPETSFHTDTLELLPADAQKLRWELLDTTHHLRQLLRGAKFTGVDIALNWIEHVILRIIWRYKLASAVPIDGYATYAEISASSGLSESLVTRTIRAAIPLNLFDAPEPGQIRHTAITRLMATDEGYYQDLGLQFEDLGPASQRLIESWEKFGDDGEPNRSAFSLTNDGKSLYNVLGEDPERAYRFGTAMQYQTTDKQWKLFDIFKAFDWSILDKPGSRLIDLGGGHGSISQTLAQHTQYMTFTVRIFLMSSKEVAKASQWSFLRGYRLRHMTLCNPKDHKRAPQFHT